MFTFERFVVAVRHMNMHLKKNLGGRLTPGWHDIYVDLTVEDKEVHDFITALTQVLHAAEMRREVEAMIEDGV